MNNTSNISNQSTPLLRLVALAIMCSVGCQLHSPAAHDTAPVPPQYGVESFQPPQPSTPHIQPTSHQVAQSQQTATQSAVARVPANDLPYDAYTGEPGAPLPGNPLNGINYPAQWMPYGEVRPWPADEYIQNGGDREQQVNIRKNWDVHNLDEADTVVHYHTVDGDVRVNATNSTPVYAPRFAAVRRLDGTHHVKRTELVGQATLDLERRQMTGQTLEEQVQQNQMPGRNIGQQTSQLFAEEVPPTQFKGELGVLEDSNNFKVTEDLQVLHDRKVDSADKARLSKNALPAEDWTENAAVQVVIDGFIAKDIGTMKASGTTTGYQMPEGRDRLEITKKASTTDAKPGDIIEFTIEYKNVGDQLIGNVTIVDHLHRRLQFISDSETSDRAGDFFKLDETTDSVVLRWEITEHLDIGESGVVTFKCRVR